MDAMEVGAMDSDQSDEKPDCTVQICRVCLLSNLDMRDLFLEKDKDSLSAKVMSFTNVKMIPNDGLPQKLCCGCAAKLESAFEFKLQVEQADTVLRSKSHSMDIKDKFFSEEGVPAEVDSDNGMDDNFLDDTFEEMDGSAEQNIPDGTPLILNGQTALKQVEYILLEENPSSQFDKKNNEEQRPAGTKLQDKVNQSNDGNVSEAENLTIKPEELTTSPEEDPLKCDNSLCEIPVENGNSLSATKIIEAAKIKVATDEDSDEANYFKHLNLRSKSKEGPTENLEPDKVFFMCYFCEKQFNSKIILKEHMYSHEEVRRTLSHKGTSECKKPLILSTDTTPLKISLIHSTPAKPKVYDQSLLPSGKKLNKCPHCGKEYLYISSYTKHLKQHEGEKDIGKHDPIMPLEILFHEDESSLDFGNCNNPKKSNPDSKPREKDVVDGMEGDYTKLDERFQESVIYTCKKCEDKFLVKKDLMIHLLSHDIGLKCKICREEFNSFKDWKTHCLIHVKEGHSSENTEGDDDSKGKSVDKNKDDDGLHLLDASEKNSWTEVLELKCPECPMTYSHRRSASRHLETHVGKKHRCEVCGLGFTRKDHLQRHMETHTGTRYHCTVCNKQFTRKDHLQRHLKQHPKIVSYKCTQCNKTFGNKLTLKNHLKVANHKTASFEPDFESNMRSKRVAAKAAREFIDLMAMELQGESFFDDDDELWTASGESYNRKEEVKIKESNVKTESEHTVKKGMPTLTNHKKQTENMTEETHQKVSSESDREQRKFERDVDNDNSDYESGFDTSMNTYECPTCNKSYSTKKSLMRHQLVHDEPNYQCDICGLKIFRRDKFNEHYDKCSGKHPDKVTKCNICGDAFESNELLREHKANHVAEGVVTEEVLKNFEPEPPIDKTPDSKLLRKRRTDIVGLKCPECNKQYNNRKNLLRHVQIHKDKKFLCDVCPKKFFRREHLKVHLAKHNIVKPYACEICPKRFLKEEQLTNHVSRHDGLPRKSKNQNGLKRYLCEICSKTFTQSTTLVAHLRAHKGIKPYVCTFCSRPFTTKAYLRMHLRTHTQERPYICQYCSKAFARADTLANHVTQHTGEAKYQCKFCQKNFRRLKNLKEHIFIHTGQRPYACPTCDRRFSNNGSRYAHRKKCLQAFIQRQSHTEALAEEQREQFRLHMHERAQQTFTQL
uniref:Protein krueppel n=2 Tax=Graphocephala atropunctata TaxID=36148 RepID=A0A1B6K9G9_9HEMI